LVHNSDHPRKTGHCLLGKLLLIIAGQATSQVKHTPLVAFTGETSNAGIGSIPKSLSSCFGEFV
jgi:hypothetical protein